MGSRLAEEWVRTNPKAGDDAELKGLTVFLKVNLYWVDKDRATCLIAAFSHYLAFLVQLAVGHPPRTGEGRGAAEAGRGRGGRARDDPLRRLHRRACRPAAGGLRDRQGPVGRGPGCDRAGGSIFTRMLHARSEDGRGLTPRPGYVLSRIIMVSKCENHPNKGSSWARLLRKARNRERQIPGDPSVLRVPKPSWNVTRKGRAAGDGRGMPCRMTTGLSSRATGGGDSPETNQDRGSDRGCSSTDVASIAGCRLGSSPHSFRAKAATRLRRWAEPLEIGRYLAYRAKARTTEAIRSAAGEGDAEHRRADFDLSRDAVVIGPSPSPRLPAHRGRATDPAPA